MKEHSEKRVSSFLRFEYVEGSLDAKTRELVLLAGAAISGCSH
jgi:alkylhydroperoxidase/carboxymuconolactone decarboxylase family protein YurZ